MPHNLVISGGKVNNFFWIDQLFLEKKCTFAEKKILGVMKVLFLTPWYPSERDKMSGLFVEKMVDGMRSRNYECEVVSSTGFFAVLRDVFLFFLRNGRPDLVHLHVTTKQALVPLVLKRFLGVPYVISEHWSGYLDANGDFRRRAERPVWGKFYSWFVRHAVRRADCVCPVSECLMDAMRRCGLESEHWRVVHNAMDPLFFEVERVQRGDGKYRFCHVSCFAEAAKNTFGIIRAAARLAERRDDFEVVMVGDGPDHAAAVSLAEDLGLVERKIVHFIGELPPESVAQVMSESDCFLLFSNYETAAVVLYEAAAVGLRIISTPVGVASEVVNERNGVLTPVGDVDVLSAKMDGFIGNFDAVERMGRESFEAGSLDALEDVYWGVLRE